MFKEVVLPAVLAVPVRAVTDGQVLNWIVHLVTIRVYHSSRLVYVFTDVVEIALTGDTFDHNTQEKHPGIAVPEALSGFECELFIVHQRFLIIQFAEKST